ncbi:MAG: ABC transporter permease [Acidobacteriota bacterium]
MSRLLRPRMQFGEGVTVALDGLRTNALRSLLTALGIIIGIAAVVTMVALGTGAQRAVQDRIDALGPTLLNVYSGQDFRGGVAIGGASTLTYDDDTAIAHDARYIAGVVPELQRNFQIKFGGHNVNQDVIGTTPDFVTVRNYGLSAGRMFTAGEAALRRRYAVLGSIIPGQLQTTPAEIVGQQIQIGAFPFTVVGVLAEKGAGPGSNDDDVMIPFETARFRVIGTGRLRTITIKAVAVDSMSLAMIEIERVLRRQHKLRPGTENDFRIRNQRDVLMTSEATTQTFKSLLVGVAAVSLLVGGIGIMNIMLVSVTERTREIGVRKAVGARKRDVLFQFVIEAVVLCLVGGVIGILVGSVGAVLLSRWAHWNTLIAPAAVLLAFGCSVAVGLFFGIWPARRAANLDPIEALHYE